MSWRLFWAIVIVTYWIALCARANVKDKVDYPIILAGIEVALKFLGVSIVFKILGIV